MTTLKGIRGIHETKHTYGDIGVSIWFWRQRSVKKVDIRCTYNAEDTKDSKNYCGGVIVSHKIIDSSANAEKDV